MEKFMEKFQDPRVAKIALVCSLVYFISPVDFVSGCPIDDFILMGITLVNFVSSMKKAG